MNPLNVLSVYSVATWNLSVSPRIQSILLHPLHPTLAEKKEKRLCIITAWGRLYEARIAYPVDKSWKQPSHPGFEQPNFNFICWITSHLPNSAICRIKFKLRCSMHGWHCYIFKTYPPDKLSKLCTTDPRSFFKMSYCMRKYKA